MPISRWTIRRVGVDPLTWLYLTLAICTEVAATSLLPRTKGFRELQPTVAVAVLYVASFFFLANTLRSMDLGIAYALWAGIGTAGIAAIGMIFLGEERSPIKVAGILMVTAGVVLLSVGGTH